MKPTGSRFLFQGNLSEGSVLVVEFSHFYHRHEQQAILFLVRGAGGMLGYSSLIGLRKNGPLFEIRGTLLRPRVLALELVRSTEEPLSCNGR